MATLRTCRNSGVGYKTISSRRRLVGLGSDRNGFEPGGYRPDGFGPKSGTSQGSRHTGQSATTAAGPCRKGKAPIIGKGKGKAPVVASRY
jgi:hypothetical protein